MEQSPAGQASDNGDSDSFYSFPMPIREPFPCGKGSPSSNRDSTPGLDSEHETSGTSERPQPGAAQDSSPKVLFGLPKPRDADQKSENSSDWSYGDAVVLPLIYTDKPLPQAPKEVQEGPSSSCVHLDSPQLRVKDYLTTDPQTQAKQKYAFTEFWVKSQHKSTEPKDSPLGEFSAALEGYFKQDQANSQETHGGQPGMEPATSIAAPAEEEMESSELNVSPLEEASQLEGDQMPAGLDF